MLSSPTIDLLAEAQAVEACRACAIGKARTHSVYAAGNPTARLFVVGEGPGEAEDQSGVPFVGPAGVLLDKMLAAIGQDRSNTYIANVVKCRACVTVDGRVKNRAPESQEVENCRPFLARQIEAVNPDVILAVGAPAAKWFAGTTFRMMSQRGKWLTIGPRPVMVTYHPSYILRLSGPECERTKSLVWRDLQAVRDRLRDLSILHQPSAPDIEQGALFPA